MATPSEPEGAAPDPGVVTECGVEVSAVEHGWSGVSTTSDDLIGVAAAVDEDVVISSGVCDWLLLLVPAPSDCMKITTANRTLKQ